MVIVKRMNYSSWHSCHKISINSIFQIFFFCADIRVALVWAIHQQYQFKVVRKGLSGVSQLLSQGSWKSCSSGHQTVPISNLFNHTCSPWGRLMRLTFWKRVQVGCLFFSSLRQIIVLVRASSVEGYLYLLSFIQQLLMLRFSIRHFRVHYVAGSPLHCLRSVLVTVGEVPHSLLRCWQFVCCQSVRYSGRKSDLPKWSCWGRNYFFVDVGLFEYCHRCQCSCCWNQR